jgi:replicative DNA helicase
MDIDDLFGGAAQSAVALAEEDTEELTQPIHSLMKPPITQRPVDLRDHENEMWDVIDAFEDRAWSSTNKGYGTGWRQLDDVFEGGLKTGWVVVAGDSNIGKTSWLSGLAWNTAMTNPNDVFVMDFSLDDPMHDKIPRVVAAANKVLINAVKMPNDYVHLPDMLIRREAGMRKLRSAIDSYRCYDANFSTDFETIYNEIKRMKVLLEEAGDGLETDHPDARGGDNQKYTWLAKHVSDMATEFDCPLITTAEFKKLNGFRRPGVDDIRESVKIKYEAKAILLCYNEVSLKGEAASIYYERKGSPAKQPIFEVKVGKNKFGSFKGRLFYEFYPELAFFDEADKQTAKKYNNVIYSNE